MEAIHAMLSIDIILCAVGLLLHIIGLYVLKVNKKLNIDSYILINLSVAEVILLINQIIKSSMGMNKYSDKYYTDGNNFPILEYKTFSNVYMQIVVLIKYTGCCEVNLLLIFLTIERLICVLSPLRYHIRLKEKSIYLKSIIYSWLISIISGLLTLSPTTLIVTGMCGYCAVAFAVLLFIVTYTVIGWKIKVSRSAFKVKAQANGQGGFKKHHVVPGFIILTFCIFYALPFTLELFYLYKVPFNKKIHIFILCAETAGTAGIVSDALIYIFLMKTNRDIIVRKILPSSRKQDTGRNERNSTILDSITLKSAHVEPIR